jgi:hypothetical protein
VPVLTTALRRRDGDKRRCPGTNRAVQRSAIAPRAKLGDAATSGAAAQFSSGRLARADEVQPGELVFVSGLPPEGIYTDNREIVLGPVGFQCGGLVVVGVCEIV